MPAILSVAPIGSMLPRSAQRRANDFRVVSVYNAGRTVAYVKGHNGAQRNGGVAATAAFNPR